MSDAIAKLLIFIGAFIVGWIVRIIIVKQERKRCKDRMDIMRICSEKQDDAIRRRDNIIRLKQARIDELEREARKERKGK